MLVCTSVLAALLALPALAQATYPHAQPSLDVTKVADEAIVSAGDTLGFTITTQNSGEDTATDAALSDPLPAGVTWSIAGQDDDSAPLECAITGDTGSQVLDCAYGDLPAGALRTVKVEAQTGDDACTIYDNTATASADNAPADSDRAVIDCLKPNVTITKTAAGSPINAGGDAAFTITVKNQGSSQSTGAATAVTLKDPLTTALSWTLGGADAPSCAIADSQLDCDFGDLAPGTTRVVTLTAPTSSVECGVYANTATVDGNNFAAKTASDTVTCQKVPSSLLVLKGPKTQAVYLDGSASYTYDVGNPETSDLSSVTVTDDHCSAISGPDKSTAADPDNDGDDLLETGETWRYTCTVKAADLFKASGEPVTNTVTATGKDQAGATLTAKDTALTTLLAPGIAIDKTGPATAIAGELITYNLAVTNTGNTSFPQAGVTLTDTALTGGACATAPTIPTSKNGDKTPGELNPGETWTYQCQVQSKSGDTKITNKGDVSGVDSGGKTVTATDTADTVLGAPAGAVSPAGKVSGRARLTGTVGCASSRLAKASVTGNSIRQVAFYVNGKKVKTLTKANSGKNYQLVLRTRSLKYGTYKVQARVQFRVNTVPQSRTLNLQFNRCRPRVIKPTFAG